MLCKAFIPRRLSPKRLLVISFVIFILLVLISLKVGNISTIKWQGLKLYKERILYLTGIDRDTTVKNFNIIEDYYKEYSKNVLDANPSLPGIKLIILAMTDASFSDMALNLYISSFKRFRIENFLFVGAEKSSNFGSAAFNRKMNIRTVMILKALKAGYSVLHTDLDIVFLQNPMTEIENILQNYSMGIQWDHLFYNAGFLAIKATKFSIDVYEYMQTLTNDSTAMHDQHALNKSSASLDDQSALNKALKEVGKRYKQNSSINHITILNRTRYLCGKYYFINNRHFPRKNNSDNCPGCMMVHNNWIVSQAAKIYRFKETNLWWLDANRYYSDENRKYLLYHNPFIKNPPVKFRVERSEIEALKTGFAMAEMLNRTLIIPRFHCYGAKNSYECPLNSWFRVKNFDTQFAPNYRESSFLLSELVPKSISMKLNTFCDLRDYAKKNSTASTCHKQDKQPKPFCISFNPNPFLLLTKTNGELLNATLMNFESSEIYDFSKFDVLDESTIRTTFGKCSDQVIVFSSLLDVKISFANNATASKFNKKVKDGFIRAGYMQF